MNRSWNGFVNLGLAASLASAGLAAFVPWTATAFAVSAGALLLALGLAKVERRALIKAGRAAAVQANASLDKVANGLSRLAAGNLLWNLSAGNETNPSALACIRSFNDVTSEPCRRLFYVGSDSQEEGQLAGQAMGQALRKGKLAVLVGTLDGINFELRRKGALNVLRQEYPAIQEVAVRESRGDPEFAYQQVSRLLQEFPDLGAVYVTEGGSPSGAARAVADAGKAGRVIVVAHDVTPATMDVMAKGLVQATVFQDPLAQGHDPAIRLHNYLQGGEAPSSRISTKVQVVTKANRAAFWDEGTKSSSTGDLSRLVKVASTTDTRARRIAVVGLADDGFWAEVKTGALIAKKTLAAVGTELDWLVPEGTDEAMRIANLPATIQGVIQQRYDAVALPLHDRQLVAAVNQAIDSGVVVATYNTEPSSLRQTMTTILDHAQSQRTLSHELDSLSVKGKQSAQRIQSSLTEVSKGLETQKVHVSETGSALATLRTTLKTIDAAARATAQGTRKMSQSAEKTVQSIQLTMDAMNDLANSSRAIEKSVTELKQETRRIEENVRHIGDIANRTDTLAINASIEAARSGAAGRGFAVIASEIRSLSVQVNSATLTIAELLKSIEAKVEHVASTTKENLDDADRTRQASIGSGQAVGKIVEAAAESDEKMESILTAVEQVLGFSAQMEGVVETLKTTNEAWNTELADSIGAAEEVTASVDQIALDAHSLAERSRSQNSMLSLFKLTKD